MIKYSQYRKICSGRDYLGKNYNSPFNLTEVAKHACMSKYHFCRVFSEVFGESPYQYISRLRIEQAKKLLVTSRFSVKEICEKVGYSSEGSFSYLFRKKVGETPTQYRRTLWQLSNDPLHHPVQSIPACYAQRFFGVKATKAQY